MAPFFQNQIRKGTVIHMQYGIIYHSNKGDNHYISTMAQAACIVAYNHMALHEDITMATIYNMETYEVIHTYIR